MKLFEALESGAIRFAGGKEFSAAHRTGSSFQVNSVAEAIQRASACAEQNGCAGAAFVDKDGDVPAAALLAGSGRPWASPVTIDGLIIGAIVEWSSDDIETGHRHRTHNRDVSFDDFNAARHGE